MDENNDSNSNADVQDNGIPHKKVRLSKKRYIQKYSTLWEQEKQFQVITQQPLITSLVPTTSKMTLKNETKAAEIKMACFLVEHNIPFNVAGHLKNLIQSINAEAIPNITFERTKAQAIITNVIGQAEEEKLISVLQKNYFSIIVDESTDRSTTKHLAIMTRTSAQFNIKDNFLCLLPITDGSAVTLHTKIVEYFNNKNIPYKQNMIGYASDGANTMFGQHNSVMVLFSRDIPHLFKIKCICHTFHLCASYACKKLPKEIETFARDVYNYLQNSPKRLGDYNNFQSYLNIKPHKLLHPCQTRWLSLLPVVQRLIEQLPALKLYFTSAVLNDELDSDLVNNLLRRCIDPMTELYLEFLNFVLPYFHNLNKSMQAEQPKLYLLHEQIFTVYKTILECFIKPEYLEQKDADNDSNLEEQILNIKFKNEEYQLNLEDIYLGGNAIMLLVKKRNDLPRECVIQFKKTCLTFYVESIKQIRSRYPFAEKEQIQNLKFINPETLLNPYLKRQVPSLAHLGQLFPVLCPRNLTELDREWRLLRNLQLPFSHNDNVKVETFWHYISTIKNGDGSQSYPLISSFVETLLCLPHSSANVERLFSSVNLMKTNVRNKLGTKSLTGLLHTKHAINVSCYDVTLTEEYKNLFNNNIYDFKKKLDDHKGGDSSVESIDDDYEQLVVM